MVCSCVVPSKRVLLQIIFCSCVIGTTFSREKWQIASLSCQEVIKIWKQSWWSNDKTIIELSYHKISWFASVSQINYLPQPSASPNNWSLLATGKSRYFSQPRPIIVYYDKKKWKKLYSYFVLTKFVVSSGTGTKELAPIWFSYKSRKAKTTK